MEKKLFEEVSMMIVAYAGEAKSKAIEAIDLAEEGKFEEADAKIEEAYESLKNAGQEHFKALQADINGELALNLLLMHAEDQFITIESFILVSTKLIKIYKKIESK